MEDKGRNEAGDCKKLPSELLCLHGKHCRSVVLANYHLVCVDELVQVAIQSAVTEALFQKCVF